MLVNRLVKDEFHGRGSTVILRVATLERSPLDQNVMVASPDFPGSCCLKYPRTLFSVPLGYTAEIIRGNLGTLSCSILKVTNYCNPLITRINNQTKPLGFIFYPFIWKNIKKLFS